MVKGVEYYLDSFCNISNWHMGGWGGAHSHNDSSALCDATKYMQHMYPACAVYFVVKQSPPRGGLWVIFLHNNLEKNMLSTAYSNRTFLRFFYPWSYLLSKFYCKLQHQICLFDPSNCAVFIDFTVIASCFHLDWI